MTTHPGKGNADTGSEQRAATAMGGRSIAFDLIPVVVILAVSVRFTPVAALLVVVWAWSTGVSWRALGLVRPRSWPLTLAAGSAAGIVLKLVMKALVLPLLGVPPVNPAFATLPGNPRRLVFVLGYAIVGAGLCEELVFRGFLFERLGRVLGDGRTARIAILISTAVFFGALHVNPQGLGGFLNAAITGLVSGVIYYATGRRIVFLIVMHAAFDIAAFVIIYFRWETAVAHLLFR